MTTGTPGYHLGMADPTWDGVIALVVGLLAFAIYWRQAQIAKMQAAIAEQQKAILQEQVRQGSFELRYDIYEETKAYTDVVFMMGADVTPDDRRDFGRLVEKARFLFSYSTWENIALVRQSTEDYIGAEIELRDRRRRELDTEGAEKNAANAAEALQDYRADLPAIFSEMRLSHGESMLGRADF